MYSSIRALLVVTAIVGVMALLSPVAHADTANITITRAEVQWDDAVVMGRGAAPNDDIYWEGESEPITRASKRGKFSFRGTVPSDCNGTLGTTSDDPESIDFYLDNCTSDSGEPDDPDVPDDPPGADPELLLYRERTNAHDGDAVRAVGFIVNEEEVGGVQVQVISGGDDALLRSWSWTEDTETEDTGDLNPEVVGILDHPIYDLEVSADGYKVVTGEGDWNGGPGSDTLRMWAAIGFFIDPEEITDPLTYPLEGTTAPIGFVYCVAIPPDPDKLRIVASGFYGEIVVYGPYGTSLLELFETKKTKKKRTKALAFSPDGAILASTSTAGRIQLWSFPEFCERDSCEPILRPVSMSHGGSWVFPIAFAPYSESDDLTQIVSGSDGGTIKVWTIDDLTGTPDIISVQTYPAPSGAVYSLDWWSTPGDSITRIVAGGDGDITVYDAANDMNILFRAVNAHAGRVNDVAFSPDGSMIVSGGADGALKLWDLSDP